MSKFENRNPIEIDSYTSRSKRVKSLYKADNIYANQTVANIVVLLCCVIDFLVLFSKWLLVTKPENTAIIVCIAVASSVALDVPLAIGGCALKEYHLGLIEKKTAKLIMGCSVAIFLIAFTCFLPFTLSTKDLSFQLQGGNMVNTLGESANQNLSSVNNTPIWIAAIYNSIIPLLTSLSSGLISYYSYSPLKEKLKKAELKRIEIESNIIDLKTALSQITNTNEHCMALLNREMDLYNADIESTKARGECLKQTARQLIMEKLNQPDSISLVTKSSKQAVDKACVETTPKQQLFEFVEAGINESVIIDKQSQNI